MKKTTNNGYRFSLAAAASLLLTASLSGSVMAQATKTPDKKTDEREVSVRIVERNGDEVRETERTFRLNGMDDPERDKVVMKLVDSLRASHKDGQKRQMTIIVEDTDGDRIVTRERVGGGSVGPRSVRPNVRPDRTLPGDTYAWRNRTPRSGTLPDRTRPSTDRGWEFELRRGTDSLADQFRRFSYQFPRDLDRQLIRPFEDWSRNVGGKTSTIRGLDAFPNNPDQNQLNLRFTAPAKGDVRIVVTNPAGKELAKRTLNNFSGEFVGQIDLGKSAKGVYFVTVTQNEDGAVKRIVVE